MYQMPSYQPYCQTWATRLNSKSTMTTMINHLLRSGFITNGVTISSRDEIITWRFRRKIAAGVFLCRSSLVLSFSLLGGYHLCGHFLLFVLLFSLHHTFCRLAVPSVNRRSLANLLAIEVTERCERPSITRYARHRP